MTLKPHLPVAKHVVSFGQAAKMHELGLRYNTMFYWEQYNDGKKELRLYAYLENSPDLIARYPAMMLCDMLEMVPQVTTWRDREDHCACVSKEHYALQQIQEGNTFYIVKATYGCAEAVGQIIITLAEAKLLVW